MERFLVRRTDYVIANTEELRRDFVERLGLHPSKVGVITSGLEENDFLIPPALDGNGQFVITHAGNLYGGRNPYSFLRAVKSLVDRGRIDAGEIRVRFIGRLAIDDPRLRELLEDATVKSVVDWRGVVSHDAALEALAQSSVALLIQPKHRLAIPAKLYEYLALRKPILALADPGSAVPNILENEGWGHALQHDDEEAMEHQLCSWYDLYRQSQLQATYQLDSLRRYTMEALARRLAAIFREAAGRC